MPTLVHLTPEKNAKRIARSGIRAEPIRSDARLPAGAPLRGVFCMPVLPDFQASHQWLRELKRGGQRAIVGVYFRLSAAERVLVGRYNEALSGACLGRAIRKIMDAPPSSGMELWLPRAVAAREIRSVRCLPQVLGWRYYPGAHGDKPSCACPVCLPKGAIKSRALRERLDRG